MQCRELGTLSGVHERPVGEADSAKTPREPSRRRSHPLQAFPFDLGCHGHLRLAKSARRQWRRRDEVRHLHHGKMEGVQDLLLLRARGNQVPGRLCHPLAPVLEKTLLDDARRVSSSSSDRVCLRQHRTAPIEAVDAVSIRPGRGRLPWHAEAVPREVRREERRGQHRSRGAEKCVRSVPRRRREERRPCEDNQGTGEPQEAPSAADHQVRQEASHRPP